MFTFPSLHCSLVVNFLHLDSDPPGVEVLADFITGDVPVNEITISSNAFGETGTAILARALCQTSSVTSMEMCTCGITAVGAKDIADMLLTNSTIKVLL